MSGAQAKRGVVIERRYQVHEEVCAQAIELLLKKAAGEDGDSLTWSFDEKPKGGSNVKG